MTKKREPCYALYNASSAAIVQSFSPGKLAFQLISHRTLLRSLSDSAFYTLSQSSSNV